MEIIQQLVEENARVSVREAAASEDARARCDRLRHGTMPSEETQSCVNLKVHSGDSYREPCALRERDKDDQVERVVELGQVPEHRDGRHPGENAQLLHKSAHDARRESSAALDGAVPVSSDVRIKALYGAISNSTPGNVPEAL